MHRTGLEIIVALAVRKQLYLRTKYYNGGTVRKCEMDMLSVLNLALILFG